MPDPLTTVSLEITDDPDHYELALPTGYLPRSGDVLDLLHDDRFRFRAAVSTVRWYPADPTRHLYRPIVVAVRIGDADA